MHNCRIIGLKNKEFTVLKNKVQILHTFILEKLLAFPLIKIILIIYLILYIFKYTKHSNFTKCLWKYNWNLAFRLYKAETFWYLVWLDTRKSLQTHSKIQWWVFKALGLFCIWRSRASVWHDALQCKNVMRYIVEMCNISILWILWIFGAIFIVKITPRSALCFNRSFPTGFVYSRDG